MKPTRFIAATAIVAATVILSAAAQEDYGGAAADWKPSFTPHGFNLQGMRRAGPHVGFKEEHFKWMKEWGFNFVRMPLDYRCWVKDRKSENREIIDEAGLKPLDEGIAFARKYGIVAMICLHRIPGEYCVPRADPEPGNIYTDPDCLRAAVLHWEMLARRYKDIPREELFFNLINEPSSQLGTIEQYEHVCRVLIAAIRKIDPKRFIVADGWAGGNIPVPGLYGIPGVGQAGRGYAPGEFSHFGMDTINAPKDDKVSPYPPTWPPKRNRPDGRLGGPRWPDWHGPFTVKDAPAANYELMLSMVSGPVRIAVQADGAEVASFALKPQPNDPAWTHLGRYRGKGPWRGMPLSPVTFTLAKPAGELSVQVVEGDWAMPRVLVAKGADGRTARVEFGMDMKAMKTVAWHRRFAGWDAADPMPALDGATPSGKFADEGMNRIYDINMKRWEEPVTKGVWCIVGEFGCANHTAHADSLRFLESNLRLFEELGMGWCAWGFIGSRFGILNSGRADVKYENWHGHKLDREMLELLRRHARKVLSTGVEIPAGGVPTWRGREQYTTSREKPPAAIRDMATYLKWKWRMDVSDPATGLDNAALKKGVAQVAREWEDKEPWADTAARMFAYLADNMAVGFSRFDCFPAIASWSRWDRPLTAVVLRRARTIDARYSLGLQKEIKALYDSGRGRANGKDFDHSAPDWDVILKLGFPGMKARVDGYEADTPFYRAEKSAAATILRFVDRLIAAAKAHPDADSPMMRKEIASLERLAKGPPRTCFDVMQFTMVYFILSEHVNRFQVRTLGNIDRLWWPYYRDDIAAGRTTEADFREEFRHFIWQFGSIDNYWGHPIYLGGTKRDGATEYNPLSEIILDVVDKEALPTPKFQIKLAGNTPDAIWNKSLDMLRRHRSLVLMNEKGMADSMKPLGLSEDERRDLLIWGCYEYLPKGRGNCTSGFRLNLLQPAMDILAGCATNAPACAGLEAGGFAAFIAEYKRQLLANADWLMAIVNESESHLAEIHPALVLSLAIDSALERGVDAFSTGMTYNFTAMGEVGFASAVDALLAVKEFVYDRRELSLSEFGRILADDWKGHEDLRLRVKRSPLKWGCGNALADDLAKDVIETLTTHVIGKPNGRSGKWTVYGLHSRAFIEFGSSAGASPDGRKAREHLSKNMAPSVGAEIHGITGTLKSYAKVRPENFPCGSVLDVMIHPSTVSGDKGLAAFRTLVEFWMANGGTALNVNIVSPETLRDAQAHPEKYENLQVRVAGWNIRWNDIPRNEQDEYIARIETVGAAR